MNIFSRIRWSTPVVSTVIAANRLRWATTTVASFILDACRHGGPGIYLVTAISLGVDGEEDIVRRRTWGWYASHAAAERSVLNNVTDMFEAGYYNTAIIERYGPGIVGMASGEWWYRAEYGAMWTDVTVSRIAKPASQAYSINFGIG